jgi:hypothetical protein
MHRPFFFVEDTDRGDGHAGLEISSGQEEDGGNFAW